MTDVYETLPRRMQEAVDLLMRGRRSAGHAQRHTWMAEEMGIRPKSVKRLLGEIAARYGIKPMKHSPFIPSVRIVYLRALELGLIDSFDGYPQVQQVSPVVNRVEANRSS